MDWYK